MRATTQQTAKILAFPRARTSAKNQKQDAGTGKTDSRRAYNFVEAGGCWYHDEAIARKPPYSHG